MISLLRISTADTCSTGDEPLYDNDAGSPDALAKYINQMKQEFSSAGLDIPVSISDLAYGWKQAGDTSSMVEAVDFFMINTFPYFGGNAKTADDPAAWSDFESDIKYFQGIAKGKPLLVTQVRIIHFLMRSLSSGVTRTYD